MKATPPVPSLRAAVIRLAMEKPELRQHLVPVLRKTATEFPSEKALKDYLEEHPDADKSKHTVKEPEGRGPSKPEDKPSGGWLSKAKAKFKDVKDSIAKSIEKAPAEVHQFVADIEHRNKRLGEMVEAAKKAPDKIGKKILSSARKEVGELKQAGHAALKILKGEKVNKEDKHAMYSASVYVVGAFLASVTGGAAIAVGALGKSFLIHVGIKAAHALLDEGFLGFEAFETGLEALKHIVAADKEPTEEEAQDMLLKALLAHTLKQFEKGISDKDMTSILKGVELPD